LKSSEYLLHDWSEHWFTVAATCVLKMPLNPNYPSQLLLGGSAENGDTHDTQAAAISVVVLLLNFLLTTMSRRLCHGMSSGNVVMLMFALLVICE